MRFISIYQIPRFKSSPFFFFFIKGGYHHTLLLTKCINRFLNSQVWCCTISNDNDIIVSGSRDGTLRLWRLATASPICVYNTGVDVFSARMSSNKRTIVALGDKYGARKLIMLRVVVTKTRSRAPSRATSPIHGGSRPTSPLRATSPLIR